MGYTTVALTDRDNLYGLPGFLDACRDNGLRPVIGAEITHETASVLVYAHGDQGYANLCRLLTERHCAAEFALGRALRASSAGLTAATESEKLLGELHGHMDIWFRLTRTRRPPAWVREREIPCLVAPVAAFLEHGDFETHRLLRAIDCNTSLGRLPPEELLEPDSLLRPWVQVRDRFGVFEQALAVTERLGESIHSRTDFGSPILPRYDCSEPALERLRRLAFDGARRRYGTLAKPVRERLEYELDLIGRKGFASYFLVVDDIVRQSPRTCGRGSGAASIVAYSLGISNVDPLRYNLMFERFINPGRTDPPDLDIDFAWDERDGILAYALGRYGREHAAMVCIQATFGFRAALREVARVYGITESEISAVTRRMPHFFGGEGEGGRATISEVLATHPRAQLAELDPPWPEIVQRAQRLVGLPSSIGTHPGGIVITPGRIDSHVPVQISAKGLPVIHWEKDGAEDMGLVKIDLLGNRSLAVIRDALAMLSEQGIVVDESRWEPTRDPRTVDLLASGNTMGVFYVESPAMRLLQKKTGRGDFEHLTIHSSLIRPAANKYTDEYIRRLHGKRYTFEHPCLAPVLGETYGIMVYQEQVSQVAMALAGFSAQDADELRKVMAKKHRWARLDDFRQRFFDGATRKGVRAEAARRIWDMCMAFSGYSFCKPHSASYCQVSFQSAWLKAHHPAAFMAAVIGNQGGFYTTQAYVGEAMRAGVRVCGPDVNASRDRSVAHGSTILVGLAQVKGLSERAREAILECRKRDGVFAGIDDFLRRTRLEESDAQRLAGAGAMDNLEARLNRPQVFWRMRCWYRGGGKGADTTPGLSPRSRRELFRTQYRALGFLTEVHPVRLVRTNRPPHAVKIARLPALAGRTVTFLGWGVTSRTVTTRYGEGMQFFTFEDETGIVETVLFHDAYRQYVRYLAWQEAFWVTGKVTESFGAVVVEVTGVVPVR